MKYDKFMCIADYKEKIQELEETVVALKYLLTTGFDPAKAEVVPLGAVLGSCSGDVYETKRNSEGIQKAPRC